MLLKKSLWIFCIIQLLAIGRSILFTFSFFFLICFHCYYYFFFIMMPRRISFSASIIKIVPLQFCMIWNSHRCCFLKILKFRDIFSDGNTSFGSSRMFRLIMMINVIYCLFLLYSQLNA